jgi:hypothetical protein
MFRVTDYHLGGYNERSVAFLFRYVEDSTIVELFYEISKSVMEMFLGEILLSRRGMLYFV